MRHHLRHLRWLTRAELAALVVAVCFFGVAAGVFFHEASARSAAQHERQRASAASALDNCQQIEAIKAQIRGTVEASLLRLPKVDYYEDHPDELAQAEKDARASVARFGEEDCYDLPVVRLAGLHQPKK